MPKLIISSFVVSALFRLGVGLQAVAEVVQQSTDLLVADLETLMSQGLGDLTATLTGPEEGRFRVSSGFQRYQFLKCSQQLVLLLGGRLSTTAGLANLRVGIFQTARKLQFAEASIDSFPGDFRQPRDPRDSSSAEVLPSFASTLSASFLNVTPKPICQLRKNASL